MAITPKRLVPGSQIAATATTYYTATNVRARIDSFSLTNTTAGAITVTVHLVPSGGTADSTNCILSSYSIAAGQTYVPPGAIGQWLEEGGTLQASASAATSVALVVSGVEWTG